MTPPPPPGDGDSPGSGPTTRGPTRSTVAGRAYLDLRRLARRDRRSTAEYLRLYALEGFLTRLAASAHAARFVLKGGMLLAAHDLRRPTVDIDFAALATSNEVAAVRERIVEVAATELPADADDGLRFDTDEVHAETIRDGEDYSGVRVSLQAHLATAVERFHVDVNVGDPIWPAPQLVHLPRLLGGQITVVGYPVVMVLAEKIVTALQRGTANTRWRDFADLYLLTGSVPVTAADTQAALVEVAAARSTTLTPLHGRLAGYGELAQPDWDRWRHRQQLDDRLPGRFAETLGGVYAFTDTLLDGTITDHATWSPRTRSWST